MTYIEKLRTAIANIMTDDQLDRPIPKLNGTTARTLLCSIGKDMQFNLPSRDGEIKAYWHPNGMVGTRKFNAEWRPLVLGD